MESRGQREGTNGSGNIRTHFLQTELPWLFLRAFSHVVAHVCVCIYINTYTHTATACFSCSSKDLYFLDPYLLFMYMHYAKKKSSRTRHRVLAVAALDKSLSMFWWRWHTSVSHLCCCCWSMAVSFWVAPITVCVYIGVPPRECRSLNYSNERTLNFLLLVDVDVSASLGG